jgi:hypothetical protein
MYRPIEQFEGGVRVDPKAEADLARWALRKPRQDYDEIPIPPVAVGAPDCDPDPYDLARQRRDRLAIDDERGEEALQ